jgi:hypothetical protein
MTDFIPAEKATTVRPSSTANLCIDSYDRKVDVSGNFVSPVWNFTINRSNSPLNGYFRRLAMTEFHLKWDTPNISSGLGNNTLKLDISGGPFGTTMTFPNQFCGTAAAVLDSINTYVNDLSGSTNFYFKIANNQGGLTKLASTTYQLIGNVKGAGTNGGYFRFRDTHLARQMNSFYHITQNM